LSGLAGVEGTVRDEAGAAIAEALVTVALGGSVYSVLTDSSGAFVLTGLPSDADASIRVHKVGHRDVQRNIRLDGVVTQHFVLARVDGVFVALELWPNEPLGGAVAFDLTIAVHGSALLSQPVVFRSGKATTWLPHPADGRIESVAATLSVFGAPVAIGHGLVSATPEGDFVAVAFTLARALSKCQFVVRQEPLRSCLVRYALVGQPFAPRSVETDAEGLATLAISPDARDSDYYCFWSSAGVSRPIAASSLAQATVESGPSIVELGDFGGEILVTGPPGLLAHVGIRDTHGFGEYPRASETGDNERVRFRVPPGSYFVLLRKRSLSATPLAVGRGAVVCVDLAEHLAAGTIRGRALPGASVELWTQGDRTTDLIHATRATDDGLFAFTSLLSGSYVVSTFDAEGLRVQRRAVIEGASIVDIGSLVDAVHPMMIRLRYDTGAPFAGERIRVCGLPLREHVSTDVVTDESEHARVASVEAESIFLGTTYGFGLLRHTGARSHADVVVPTAQGQRRLILPAGVPSGSGKLRWLTTRDRVAWVVVLTLGADGVPRFAGSNGEHQFLAAIPGGWMSLRGVASDATSDLHLSVSPTVSIETVRRRSHTFDAVVARLGDFDIEVLGLSLRRRTQVAGHGPLATPTPGAVRIIGRAVDGTVVEEGLLAAND